MELCYWRPNGLGLREGEASNFGDELNIWLWPKIFPDLFDGDKSAVFMGIGSLLGYPRQFSKETKHVVLFGTGAISEEAATVEPLDSRWHKYFVRGPETARVYGFDGNLGITDPAILVANYFQRSWPPMYELGYMPHIFRVQERALFLRKACDDNGILFVDPRDSIESIMEKMGAVSLMICEAMHGAIAADAIRVPWISVYTSKQSHHFKWNDFCLSLDRTYRPFWSPDFGRFAEMLKIHSPIIQFGANKIFGKTLSFAKYFSKSILSSDESHNKKLQLVEEKIETLKSDIAAGMFNL